MFTFMQTEYKNIKINESYSNLKEPKEIQENRLPDLIFDVVITKGLHIMKKKMAKFFIIVMASYMRKFMVIVQT